MRFFIASFIALFFFAAVQAQDLGLANEYFLNGEYGKARELYEKLLKNEANTDAVHKNYLAALEALKDFPAAEKYLKRLIKAYPSNIYYRIDQGLLLVKSNKQAEAQKYFEKVIRDNAQDELTVRAMAQYFAENKFYDYAEATYLQGRKAHGDNRLFSFELANIYLFRQNLGAMLDELLAFIGNDPGNLDYIKNTLQSFLTKEEDYKNLEKILMTKIQANPNSSEYTELLIWLYIQQKSFSKAFFQARALDKRFKMGGEKVMEIGIIAYKNKNYEDAITIFEYIVQQYQRSLNYVIAKNYLINAKEEVIKTTFPVDLAKINSLISDYKGLFEEVGPSPNTAESLRNMALLYAFYFNKRDTAITILNYAMGIPQIDRNAQARYKLDIGDIYLLKEEPWESTLLYSQVEKSEKERPLGHEAKLKNAKLSYYKGDFTLAQSHLDILKLATSREIANDAMDLSLLIQDNTGLDSNETAMKEYAAVDLLLFQNKKNEALARLDQLLAGHAGHSLEDEIYMQKAKIFMETGNFHAALENLQVVNTKYDRDIYGDDALFLTARIYEENLKDKAKAIELYNAHLVKYPGSIFTAEARKRFRKLRGDSIN